MRRYFAELVGTFVLVFGGVGTAVLAGSKVGDLGVAFAFGLILLAMAYAIGPHLRLPHQPRRHPRVPHRRAHQRPRRDRYIVGQIVGGIIAATLLLGIAKSAPGGYDAGKLGFGTNGYGDHSPTGYHLTGVLIIEIVLTGLLVFTVLACTDAIAVVGFAGIPIGLTLALIHLVSIPVDNTSVNPARSIGPALFAGSGPLSQIWVFIIAPVVGGVAGALGYRALFTHSTPVPPEISAVATESQKSRRPRETAEISNSGNQPLGS